MNRELRVGRLARPRENQYLAKEKGAEAPQYPASTLMLDGQIPRIGRVRDRAG